MTLALPAALIFLLMLATMLVAAFRRLSMSLWTRSPKTGRSIQGIGCAALRVLLERCKPHKPQGASDDHVIGRSSDRGQQR